MIDRSRITGLVLAGGRAVRMGGIDKGLQRLGGRPLAELALERLAPQVGPLMVSANRHADAYAAIAAPVHAEVVADRDTGFAGPLAGVSAALERCTTPYLAVVPCDAPRFPVDLVARLGTALERGAAEVAVAATTRPEPTFLLLRADLAGPLAGHLAAGGRKVMAWAETRRLVQVPFADAEDFTNLNTLDELQALQQRQSPRHP